MDMPPHIAASPFPDRAFSALLFDMDGTLISSVASANRVWSRWAEGHGIDPAKVLAIMHGVRAIETIRTLGVPDPEAETERLTQMEMDDTGGIEALPGTAALLASLPADRWAIVTSAPRALAEKRLATAGLPIPAVFVTAEDVSRGKPAPDCYRLAARRLGVDPSTCLVLEDAPAGIAAGEAAGAAVLVLTATHHTPLATTHPSVPDYAGLIATPDPDGHLVLQERD